MKLLDFWLQDQAEVRRKTLQQLIGFAGDGRLCDDSLTAQEFREFLGAIPHEMLQAYARQCLEQPFTNSGYALQDVVNEIGSRLDFDVEPGRYQGRPSSIGFDGLWTRRGGHTIVVEVKTTDAYRIDIDAIARYRRDLIGKGRTTEGTSSVLVVVGRQDTGGLEAQIRGSRHAWDMRLISIESLTRLMTLKHELQDPQIIQRMHDILIPREFTKLDEVVEIMFSTAQDMKPDSVEEDVEGGTEGALSEPVAYHKDCVASIETHLRTSLIPRTRVLYSTPSKDTALVCIVSKEYQHRNRTWYWFGFHPYQAEFLSSAKKGYVALGCGTKDTILLMDFDSFRQWLPQMNRTERLNKSYWHVHVHKQADRLVLKLRNGKTVPLSSYLI